MPSGAAGDGGAGEGAASGVAAASSAGAAGARRDFMAEVAARLARHKRYPRGARRRGEEGAGLLRFTMDREGRVLSASIMRSSGHERLDQAILDMLARAEPLPEIPRELGLARMEFSLPVSFELR